MRASPWIVTALLLSGSAPTLAAAAPRLWLRLEHTRHTTFTCSGTETETFIYRDGLVVQRTLAENGVATFVRAKAPARALADLGNALSANKVGTVEGDCRLDAFQPNEFFATTVTWLGKPPSKNTFSVKSEGQACSAAENRIANALQQFVARAVSNPVDRNVVEVPFQPKPGCERE